MRQISDEKRVIFPPFLAHRRGKWGLIIGYFWDNISTSLCVKSIPQNISSLTMTEEKWRKTRNSHCRKAAFMLLWVKLGPKPCFKITPPRYVRTSQLESNNSHPFEMKANEERVGEENSFQGSLWNFEHIRAKSIDFNCSSQPGSFVLNQIERPWFLPNVIEFSVIFIWFPLLLRGLRGVSTFRVLGHT